ASARERPRPPRAPRRTRPRAIARSSLPLFQPRHAVAREAPAELLLAHLERLVNLRRLPDLDRVILPLWMPLPVVRHQEPAQIGMSVNHDAEHVPHFTLR